eukprot:scaffold37076_cov34-Prasinocladus_malaysianus.AAC.1
MAQAAAQAAAAGVVLPPSVQAQLQQQQQQFAAAAAAAAQQPSRVASVQSSGATTVPTAGHSNGVDHSNLKNRGDEWAAEPLFGGAMQMELPLRFNDISNFRPVPDHQEVSPQHGVCRCNAGPVSGSRNPGEQANGIDYTFFSGSIGHRH